MENLASWIAPLATSIAACMTAANLGARVTGWGFVVFTVGSLAWTGYGAVTGQPNLVWQNLFLTIVNAAGIWRWLGRQARIEDGARIAAERSETTPGPTLFPSSMLQTAPVAARDGEAIGTAVGAMIDSADGRIAYLVVAAGGVAGLGEDHRILPWTLTQVGDDKIMARIASAQIETLRAVGPKDWPGGWTFAVPEGRSSDPADARR